MDQAATVDRGGICAGGLSDSKSWTGMSVAGSLLPLRGPLDETVRDPGWPYAALQRRHARVTERRRAAVR